MQNLSVKFLLISRNTKLITLYVLVESMVILLGPKLHRATLRTLSNGEKVPSTLPLLVTNEVITEFEAMANICNKYYPCQCTTINHNSILPSTLNHLTDDKLSSFGTFLQKLLLN